jgi:hypothetical protein
MMKEEFDFEKIGKQMPYKVPSDFFENITEQTLSEAEDRVAAKPVKNISLLWSLSVAASVALLLIAGYFIYTVNLKEDKLIAESNNNTDQVTQIPDESDTSFAPENEHAPVNKISGSQYSGRVANVNTKPAIATGTESLAKQQAAGQKRKETFAEILKDISDEDLLQIAAIAESDLYVYEETLSDE